MNGTCGIIIRCYPVLQLGVLYCSSHVGDSRVANSAGRQGVWLVGNHNVETDGKGRLAPYALVLRPVRGSRISHVRAKVPGGWVLVNDVDRG